MSKNKKQQDKNQTEEPLTSYDKEQSKTIRFFSSHEEMEQDKLKGMASRNPEERIRNVTKMLDMFYKEELRHPPQHLSIKFK